MSNYILDNKGRNLIRVGETSLPTKRGRPKGFIKKTFWFKCRSCGKDFPVSLKRYNQGIGLTCSMRCLGEFHRGINNPNYKDGKRARRVAQSRRKRIVNRVGKCENCGFDLMEDCLEVNHILPVHRGGDSNEENLQVLCSICHRYFTTHNKLPNLDLSNAKLR